MIRLFMIIGLSASGKDTICKNLLNMKELGLKKVVQATTREPRAFEVYGDVYQFFSQEEFMDKIREDYFIEYRSYNHSKGRVFYGSVLPKEDGNYVMSATIEMYDTIKRTVDAVDVFPIKLEVPGDQIIQRSINREKEEANPNWFEVCRRYCSDVTSYNKFSESGIKHFDNSDGMVDQTTAEIALYIKDICNMRLDILGECQNINADISTLCVIYNSDATEILMTRNGARKNKLDFIRGKVLSGDTKMCATYKTLKELTGLDKCDVTLHNFGTVRRDMCIGGKVDESMLYLTYGILVNDTEIIDNDNSLIWVSIDDCEDILDHSDYDIFNYLACIVM